jgi:hypothetical protein
MSSNELSVNIEFVEPHYGKRAMFKSADSNTLRFTLANESDSTMNVLNWHTPLKSFDSDMFEVKKGGKKAVYLGPVVKWGAPTEKDYLTLEPKSSETVEFDLAQYYDISDAGDYSIQYNSNLLDVGTQEPKMMAKMAADYSDFAPLNISSNVAHFRLMEDITPKQFNGVVFDKIPLLKGAKLKAPSFKNCTAEQEKILGTALAEAVKMAKASKDILVNTYECARPEANRLTNWFGAYDRSRYDVLKSNYGKIWDALANKDIVFNAKCDPAYCRAFAYVHPANPYEIFLGNAFWKAPLKGTDCQAGTIIHETTHFYVVVGTNDFAYGQSDCQNLATNDVAKAIANADSHEYFAENNPSRSMGSALGGIYNIISNWHDVPSSFKEGINAALNGDGPFKGKCYFFKGDSYIRYDWAADRADSGYPRKIKDGWHNLPAGFTRDFDAAVNGSGPFKGKCYFFKGDSYIRYDWKTDRVDPAYPKKVMAGWNGLPAGFEGGFDAMINGSGPFAGKCYIFKGDSYIRYDWKADRADIGYPAKITNNWHRIPAGFENKFDAAMEGDGKFASKGYFFKGASYIRYNWEGDCVES